MYKIIHIINSCVAMIWILLQAAVVKTLGRDAREKHKFDTALKYAKDKLTDFRSEERRKVRHDKMHIILYIYNIW